MNNEPSQLEDALQHAKQKEEALLDEIRALGSRVLVLELEVSILKLQLAKL